MIMHKVAIEINPQEFKKAIARLKPKERIKLLEELEEELFPLRFKEIVSLLRSKARKPVSLKKITRLCKKARKKIHEEETLGRH